MWLLGQVREERDKNERTVKDLSQILANNQEAQLNMVTVMRDMKSKVEMLERRGLLEPAPIPFSRLADPTSAQDSVPRKGKGKGKTRRK